MSILVFEVLSEGLLFGADRKITVTRADGSTGQEGAQTKVLKWPTEKYLLGFVGAAEIGGLAMEEWLDTHREEFEAKESLERIARELEKKVQAQRLKDEGNRPPEPLIIHIGGFEKKDNWWVPYVWCIRNVYRHGRFGYLV